jgi:hypothetical protein
LILAPRLTEESLQHAPIRQLRGPVRRASAFEAEGRVRGSALPAVWRDAAGLLRPEVGPQRVIDIVPIRAEAPRPPRSLQEAQAAEAMFREMFAANPLDHFAAWSLAAMRLQDGDFREGAQLHEARLLDAGSWEWKAPELPFPRWSGEPLDGKRVLIWPEQGLGDHVRPVRPGVAGAVCDVTLVCASALERQFLTNLPVRVRTQGAEGVRI